MSDYQVTPLMGAICLYFEMAGADGEFTEVEVQAIATTIEGWTKSGVEVDPGHEFQNALAYWKSHGDHVTRLVSVLDLVIQMPKVLDRNTLIAIASDLAKVGMADSVATASEKALFHFTLRAFGLSTDDLQ
jgi:uncharacterized tellurite resistance protein B-like protein